MEEIKSKIALASSGLFFHMYSFTLGYLPIFTTQINLLLFQEFSKIINNFIRSVNSPPPPKPYHIRQFMGSMDEFM
jgi:hypothetical protein